MRRAPFVALLAALVIAPATASADDAAIARAKLRFTAGAQAYREARYKDAIDYFMEAYRFDPRPELVYNVGQAYEKLGDVPNALRSYRDYVRLAPGASDRATVETSIKNLEARLREKGIQQVSVFSTPPGATVMLDGQNVGKTPWTGEITPGRHTVTLDSAGFTSATKDFTLTRERAMDIDVALTAAPVAPATPTAPLAPKETPKETAKEPPPDAKPPLGGVKPWTFAALGVGVAGFGAAIGLELARSSAETAAKNDPTQVGYADKYDSMVGLRTAARVVVAIGAAATAAGVVLLVVDLRAASKASAPPKVGFGCFVSGCGALAQGSF